MSRIQRSSPNEVLAIAQRAHEELAGEASYPFPWQWDRSRYPMAWLCSRPTEASVQTQILAHLARWFVRAFPVDAGAKAIRGRARGVLGRADRPDLAAAVLRGRTGAAQEGVSDIVGTLPGGRSLYLEVKQPEWLEWHPERGVATQVRSAGRPTPAQLRFLADMYRQNALVAVVWSTGDVDELLGAPGQPRRDPYAQHPVSIP
jgi:hypothetical protein